jgi:precorrin-4/cobalt-precorrin-4 C11-methyltransferase
VSCATVRPLVSFVGAGPGAADLLPLRAVGVLEEADLVIWARSLVSEDVLGYVRDGVEVHASDDRTLEQITALYRRAVDDELRVARLQSGDPAIYGAIHEQMQVCIGLGLPWEIVPGVSSLGAAAAALGHELTVPDVSQTLILTRRATRTSMPSNEQLVELAAHGTTMALFLSVRRPRELQQELLDGGYAPDTACAVVYKASWPDEVVIRCPLAELAAEIKGARITTQALVLIGPGLRGEAAPCARSHVYDPGFGHRYRPLGRGDLYRKKAAAAKDASP